MDNITHSLVGVALADLAVGRRSAKGRRPLLVGAGIIAANLPDIDVAYSAITPTPLGYLLHHRGHTHTIGGLAVLALALGGVYWLSPAVRRMRLSDGVRFWLLIAAALASHLALDSLNSYGIHPFYPFSNAWYFGDAVFILEPWLWLILGVAVVWNGRTRATRLIAAMPVLMLLGTAAATRIVPLDAAVALGAAGIACAVAVRRLSAPTRAAVALVLCTGVVSGFTAASRVSRGAALRALAPELRGHVVDVILTPNPSSPLCWAVIAVELREASGEYVLWRGTLSLLPSWRAPAECASHRLAAGGHLRTIGEGRVVLRDELHQPLRRLRTLAADDCWVRAWLQFGRAPVIDEGAIFDMRFSERIGQNFSRMRIETREGCPRFIPGWHMPRADLLE